ncbi:hypothetical protein ACJMK2_037353 [Sinanodonta woodiana]|uniref:Ycf1 n=1 Tax=Sinanodonta woodiana TaxID=1069815 RepID=A0ABD3WM56_SINWO
MENFYFREGNGICHKIMQYNQKSELKNKIEMKRDQRQTFEGTRLNIRHSYQTRLQTKRKHEFLNFHTENDRFEKKTRMLEFSSEENRRLKKRRQLLEIYDKDVGIMHGNKLETDPKKIKNTRKSCEFFNKIDVQIKVKRSCRNNNQVGNLEKPQVSYSMNETNSSTPSNDKKVF